MKTAAIYARVSSDKQKEENTIASQTAALTAFAAEQGYAVPTEWIFEDEGYSGASLIRPGLERVRDLAAEGELDAVLVYAPDRLSRRYAYQILLIEELARAGVETLFIRSPRATTPEDQLLLQFQGMIAEYERAQILERSRRGKRHRARQGQVSVLSGAPFGYRYVRKSEQSAAYYEINEVEAPVVRWVYACYIKVELVGAAPAPPAGRYDGASGVFATVGLQLERVRAAQAPGTRVRGMVSGRGSHRPEKHLDPSVGTDWQPAGGTKGSRLRLGLCVWCGLSVAGQGGGADHADLQYRRDEPSPLRDQQPSLR